MKKNKYMLDGRGFSSQRELSVYCGVHEKTIAARLRHGLSLQEACKKEDKRDTYYVMNGERKSLKEICRCCGQDKELVRNRLAYGYSIEEAVSLPKKVSRQGNPLMVNGMWYPSLSAALRNFGLEAHESAIRYHMKRGRNPDDVFAGFNKFENKGGMYESSIKISRGKAQDGKMDMQLYAEA